MDPLEYRQNNPYAKRLHDEYNQQYAIASIARSKGLDPSSKVESQTTYDLAERVEKAVGPPGATCRAWRQPHGTGARAGQAARVRPTVALILD